MPLRCLVSYIGALLLLFLLSTPAQAQERGRDKGASVSVEVVLTSGERDTIRDFYAGAGDQRAESLPPGIRKNLARGKPLPPGIAKKQVPGELRSRLGLPDGYEVVEVGLDVLLVEVATGVIHDLLMDVIR